MLNPYRPSLCWQATHHLITASHDLSEHERCGAKSLSSDCFCWTLRLSYLPNSLSQQQEEACQITRTHWNGRMSPGTGGGSWILYLPPSFCLTEPRNKENRATSYWGSFIRGDSICPWKRYRGVCTARTWRKPNAHCPLFSGHSNRSIAGAEPVGFNPLGTRSAPGLSCPVVQRQSWLMMSVVRALVLEFNLIWFDWSL